MQNISKITKQTEQNNMELIWGNHNLPVGSQWRKADSRCPRYTIQSTGLIIQAFLTSFCIAELHQALPPAPLEDGSPADYAS